MVHRRPHVRVPPLLRGVRPARRKNDHPARRQPPAELRQDRSLLGQRHVPHAVPGHDQVVRPGQFPPADVGEGQPGVRVPVPCEGEHRRGHVDAVRGEAVPGQQAEAAARTAPHVQGHGLALDEGDGPLDRGEPVSRGVEPPVGDPVVAGGDLVGGHAGGPPAPSAARFSARNGRWCRRCRTACNTSCRRVSRPELAVDGGAGPCLGRLSPQDAGGVPPQCREQGASCSPRSKDLIVEPLDVELLVRTHQQRAVHRYRPHNPIGEEDLGVGDVADTLHGAPLARDGSGEHLLRRSCPPRQHRRSSIPCS